jgi:hypothetical protein
MTSFRILPFGSVFFKKKAPMESDEGMEPEAKLVAASTAYSSSSMSSSTSSSSSSKGTSRTIFAGFRGGLLNGTVLVTCVLVLNLAVTISLSLKGMTRISWFSRIYFGDCDQVKRKSLWLHLAINALSSLILGASNFAMQVAVSPTREEIDRAHARNEWLDIGE